MSIPKFEDIGKRTNQILNGFYERGKYNFALTSKITGNDIKLEARCDANGRSRASFLSKIDPKSSDLGAQLQMKWNTDNVYFGEIAFCDTIQPGTRFGVTGSLAPRTGMVGAAITGNLVRNNFRADCAVNKENDRFHMQNSFVIRYGNYLFGYQCTGFKAEDWKASSMPCLAYIDPNVEASILRTPKSYEFMILNKASGSFETTAKMAFNGKQTNFEIGGAVKNELGDAQIMAKLDTNAALGVGVLAKLGGGITLTFTTKFDNILLEANKQTPKFTLGVELQL